MEQSFVSCAQEGKDGLLSEYLGFVGALKPLVESIAERPTGGGGGDDEVFDVVRAGQAVGWRRWKAGRHRWWLKEGRVVSIGPWFGWSASLKEKGVRINEAIPVRVIDEEGSPFFLGQAV